MNYHAEKVHEYGETCELYPCEEYGFSGQDIKSLKDHSASVHNNTSKESDDEWNPSREEEESLHDAIETAQNRKYKRKQTYRLLGRTI